MVAKYLFLSDFDGTITLIDTVEAMVDRFARGEYAQINQQWRDKVLDTETTAKRILEMFAATEDELREFLNNIAIDPFFTEFVHEVQAREDRLMITSDGYDYNIDLIMNREGLGHIPFYANHLIIREHEFSMSCGFFNPQCGLCGTCKRLLMDRLRSQHEIVVYIGDGFSDMCVSEYADIVLAKGRLITFCRENRLPCIEVEGFSDILEWYRTVD